MIYHVVFWFLIADAIVSVSLGSFIATWILMGRDTSNFIERFGPAAFVLLLSQGIAGVALLLAQNGFNPY